MARRARKARSRRRHPPGRYLLRWLAVGIVGFVAFLYSQPLRSYFTAQKALKERTQEVRSLHREKQQLQRRLTASDTSEDLARQARRLGYVKPGERLFIVKGLAAWRRQHEHRTP